MSSSSWKKNDSDPKEETSLIDSNETSVENDVIYVDEQISSENVVEPPSSSSKSHFPTDEYLMDDEEFLAGDSVLIMENRDSAVVQQLEHAVVWKLENFLNENGEPRNRLLLRADPPVLVVTSKDENNMVASAEFTVTEDFAATLGRALSDVHKAYYGVRPSKLVSERDESPSTPFEAIMNFTSDHWLKILPLVVLVILTLVL